MPLDLSYFLILVVVAAQSKPASSDRYGAATIDETKDNSRPKVANLNLRLPYVANPTFVRNKGQYLE